MFIALGCVCTLHIYIYIHIYLYTGREHAHIVLSDDRFGLPHIHSLNCDIIKSTISRTINRDEGTASWQCCNLLLYQILGVETTCFDLFNVFYFGYNHLGN